MAQVDHVIDTRAKEIVGGGAGKHHGGLPEINLYWKSNWEFREPGITRKASVHAGSGDFSGPTSELIDAVSAVSVFSASTGTPMQLSLLQCTMYRRRDPAVPSTNQPTEVNEAAVQTADQ